LHLDVCGRDGDRVAGVHRDPAGSGSIPVRDQGRVAAADANVIERRAEILGAYLRENRLVALARTRDADEHLDVAAIVDLHRRPLAGTDAPPLFEMSGEPQADPSAVRAQVGLTLAPTGVVEQIERARELERIVAPVV